MARVKRGVAANKRRKNLLKLAKGFRWRRKSHYVVAKQAVIKAGIYKYRDRRTKKRTMRNLWIIRLNNALRINDLRYSTFINLMKKKNVILDRKVLSQLAMENPAVFTQFVQSIK
jgi:large subunit ribosomal protein L20